MKKLFSWFAFLCAAALSGVAIAEPTTFSRDVAPIFFKNCTMCHRPGQVAPMSLLTYAEARPWAKSIAKSVKQKDMPPWSGQSEHYKWRNDLSLSEDEIATVVSWAEQGAPEGKPEELPAPPQYPEGWTLGTPDYVITLNEVKVPADGEDLFLKQTLELNLGEPKWVRAIEFLPGDRRVTHHFQTTYRSASGNPGTGAADSAVGGILAIWTAGMPPFVFPEGVGRPLDSSVRVLVDSHYHPFGKETTDQTRIGLYFGQGPLKKEVATLAIANTGIRIPPGAADHKEVTFNLLDRDMQIIAFSPHLHVRGKAMRYELVQRDGSRELLLDVPKYNYNWQWQYYPNKPIDAPAGSRIEVTATWDNSPGNPSNPDPSKEIRYRGNTLNEMFVGFVEVIPKDGVYHESKPGMEKLKELLADHPREDSYLVNGFLPFGLYVPKDGEGWLYIAQGVNMFSIKLDKIEWNGDKLRVMAQLPTAEASATESIFEGNRAPDGRMDGVLKYGIDSPKPMNMPVKAIPMTLAQP